MSRTIRTLSQTAFIVGTLVFFLAPVSLLSGVTARLPRSLVITLALAVLLATVALQIAYILLWAGRQLTERLALGRFVPDCWLSALIGTAVAASCWPSLARIAGVQGDWIRLGPVMTTLAVVLTIHRIVGLRGRRGVEHTAKAGPGML